MGTVKQDERGLLLTRCEAEVGESAAKEPHHLAHPLILQVETLQEREGFSANGSYHLKAHAPSKALTALCVAGMGQGARNTDLFFHFF